MTFDVSYPFRSRNDSLRQSLGPVLSDGDVLALRGDLGAGKTHFVQALPRAWASTMLSSARRSPF